MSTINIITNPTVTLIGKQVFQLPEHYVGWETDAPSDAETLVEFSGRICFNSYGADMKLPDGHKAIDGRKGNDRYIKNILSSGHHSVTEHAVWSILIEGVSRSLSHELIRHRHLSPSQLSQRYVDESDIAFVVPPELKPGTNAFDSWAKGCSEALGRYREILEYLREDLEPLEIPATMKRKRIRQTARAVLPNAAETKLVMTGNARAWRHMLHMRGSEGADTEIRRMAVAVARVLKQEAPNLFMDVEILDAPDGTEILQLEYV
jgi:thymidylate synthase (FAD)